MVISIVALSALIIAGMAFTKDSRPSELDRDAQRQRQDLQAIGDRMFYAR
ncbi:hypothetical protein [Nocardia camponoti]|uniref:Uncharacterized protein n=1 Tax=Nocardia camponoti TaxID=1616106 RepID=A0A917QT25_9NOCA|nr:hypothetical protein [Nocardia camponoti]GGK66538.1 hypothetical protein GCM10011591_43390 [Nocardia camponoti]